MKPGDGVVFDAADWRSPEEPEEGGRVFAVRSHLSGEIELQFGNGAVRFARIRAGDWLWRTHDPDIDRVARPFLDPSVPMARQRVNVSVEAREGAPLRAVWSLETQPQISVSVESRDPLHRRRTAALRVESLREQFGRLGNTAYELGEITLDVEGSLFAAVSTLNQMRREAVEKLQAAETHRPPVEIHDPRCSRSPQSRRAATALIPRLTSCSGSHAGATGSGALTRARQHHAGLSGSLRLASFDRPREGQRHSGASRQSARAQTRRGAYSEFSGQPGLPDPGPLRPAWSHALRESDHAPLIGDFSLNVSNSISAELFLDLGLDG